MSPPSSAVPPPPAVGVGDVSGTDWEVAIVGAGPAGLSAALILGRCRRRVLICDDGRRRNAPARHVSGYLTREGVPPQEFHRLAREQVLGYPSVVWWDGLVEEIVRRPDERGFDLRLGGSGSGRVGARKVLLATGLVDELPEVPGVRECWGRSVFVCPFCDGWESRDRPLAVWALAPCAVPLAQELTLWSERVVFFAGDLGSDRLDGDQRRALEAARIEVIDTGVAELEHHEGRLRRVRGRDGRARDFEVLFLATRQHQRSPLPAALGCRFNPDGTLCPEGDQGTGTRGLFAAGNATEGLQMAILAAAEGCRAAHAINDELLTEDLRER